jgi:aryl-alcohol dehydrogenase-like predicted oxidoreductase
MQFTKFGQTGLTVSRMILGTGTFGKQTDEKEAHRMLDKAAEAGINFIDTADLDAPGAEVGGAEISAGRWLSNKRAGFILATKGGGKMGPAAWDAGSSRKHLLDAIDASLRRLNTDYVDLYQLHMDDPVTPIDEMVGAMDTIVRSGRARYKGSGNRQTAWNANHDLISRVGAGESCHYFGHSWRKPRRAVDRHPGRRGLQTRQHIENEVGRIQHRIPQGRRREVGKGWR